MDRGALDRAVEGTARTAWPPAVGRQHGRDVGSRVRAVHRVTHRGDAASVDDHFNLAGLLWRLRAGLLRLRGGLRCVDLHGIRAVHVGGRSRGSSDKAVVGGHEQARTRLAAA